MMMSDHITATAPTPNVVSHYIPDLQLHYLS